MEFLKQHLSLYLTEAGLLFGVLLIVVILQIAISKQQIYKPYRLVGLTANMIGSVILSIWVSSTCLTFFETIVQSKGFIPFYISYILPVVLGAWVIYGTAIVCTHFLTIAVEEHKIYKRTEQVKKY